MLGISRKHFALVLFAIFILLVSKVDAQDNLKKGIDAVKKGDYVAALNYLKDVVKSDKSYEANYYYGEALLKTGSLEDARKYFEIALKDDDEGVDALRGLGDYYSLKKDYTKAHSYYQKALKIDPNNIPVMLAEADAYVAEGKLDDANNLLFLAKATSKQVYNREDPTIYVGIGNVYLMRGSYKAAIENYDKALALNKNLATAYFGKGKAYYKERKYNEALSAYNDAIQKDPNYADAYLEIGKILYFADKFDEAATAFKKFSTLKPGSQEGNSYYAKTLYAQGRFDDALKILNEVLKIDPNSITGNLYTAYIYSEKKAEDSLTQIDYYKKAVEYFQKVPLKEFEAEDFGKFGKVMENLGDNQKAIELYHCAIKLDSANSLYYYNLGIVHLSNNANDSAVYYFEKATDYGSKSKVMFFLKGLAYYNLQKYDRAASSFEEATKIDDQFTRAFLMLGNSYYYLNKFDNATKAYTRVLELEPNNVEASNALKAIQNKNK